MMLRITIGLLILLLSPLIWLVAFWVHLYELTRWGAEPEYSSYTELIVMAWAIIVNRNGMWIR